MIRIAIVEDDKMYQRELKAYLKRYAKERDEEFDITVFSDGIGIVDKYNASYDIIFLDILMKIMNGIETAQKIRQKDPKVLLVFITNTSEYAIQGYKVNALDYILKPIDYFALSQELDKIIKKIQIQNDKYLTIPQTTGVIRMPLEEIYYLESQGHNITTHTQSGSYTFRGTVKEMEERLEKEDFARCNSGYLVNLRWVEAVKYYTVIVGGESLQISRPRKKKFMEILTDYLGGK